MVKRPATGHPPPGSGGLPLAKQGAQVSLSQRLQEAAAMRRGEAPADDPGAAEDGGADPGLPAPCPTCEGPGFLDLIDIRNHRQHEHCVRCGISWVRPV